MALTYFSKEIVTGEEKRMFYFNPILYSGPIKYNVTFFNSDNDKIETLQFSKNQTGQWKVQAQNLPEWICNIELELVDAIGQNELN